MFNMKYGDHVAWQILSFFVVGRTCTRSILPAILTMKIELHGLYFYACTWFCSFSYGAPLGTMSGRWSSAINLSLHHWVMTSATCLESRNKWYTIARSTATLSNSSFLRELPKWIRTRWCTCTAEKNMNQYFCISANGDSNLLRFNN